MQMIRLVIAVALGLGPALTLAADTLQLDLNDDAARIAYAHPIEARNLRLDGSWQHHQDRGEVIGGGLHVMGNAGTGKNPVQAGLGARALWLDADQADADGSVLALGGYFHYTLPRYNRFAIGGYLYFAPDVIAFGDAEQFQSVGFYGSYELLQQADIYVGVRNIKADFTNGVSNYNFDTGLHLGVRIEF